MVFCGHCGSPLAPDATRCPHCGTVSDVVSEVTAQDTDETLHIDDPTIESRTLGSMIQGAYPTHTTPSPYPTQQNRSLTPPEQHKLILPSNGGNYDAQGAFEATSAMRPSNYQTYPSSSGSAGSVSAPSSPYNTIVEQTSYPNANYPPTQATPNYQSNPGPVSNYGNYAPYAQQYTPIAQPVKPLQPSQQPQRRRRGIPILLAVLLLLVLASGAFVVYALHHAQVVNNGGNTGNTSGGTSQTTTIATTPADHAKAVVQQYYTDINNKDYHDAYYLWVRDGRGQTYASFVHGYAHTIRDELTIHNVVASGNTEKVFMTIVATEGKGNETSQHTYNGYYTVGQVNGTWKILGGYLY